MNSASLHGCKAELGEFSVTPEGFEVASGAAPALGSVCV